MRRELLLFVRRDDALFLQMSQGTYLQSEDFLPCKATPKLFLNRRLDIDYNSIRTLRLDNMIWTLTSTGPDLHEASKHQPKHAVQLWQILVVLLFQKFPSTPSKSGRDSSCIGKLISLAFSAYLERPKRSPYVAWASIFVRPLPAVRTSLANRLGFNMTQAVTPSQLDP